MRRINLLPPEERRRGAALRAPGGVLGILLVAGGVVVLLMVGIYAFYLLRVGNQEDQIADLDRQIAEQERATSRTATFQGPAGAARGKASDSRRNSPQPLCVGPVFTKPGVRDTRNGGVDQPYRTGSPDKYSSPFGGVTLAPGSSNVHRRGVTRVP